MMSKAFHRAVLVLLAAGALNAAETMVEYSSESRFQLDVHVPDAVLQARLPEGWKPNVAAQGPAKDCNLRVIFIDRVTINGPDGKPVGKGSNRLVYLVAPVKDPSGANVQLVIGGLTEDPADAPGPFGVYLPATTHTMQRSTLSGAGPIVDSQDWVFGASTGEHLELHIKYERGVGNKGNPSDTKFYSAKNPGFFQISRQEQVLDILAQRDDQSSRPGEGVFVQSVGRQLRQAVRRHGENVELGQYSLDQSISAPPLGKSALDGVRVLDFSHAPGRSLLHSLAGRLRRRGPTSWRLARAIWDAAGGRPSPAESPVSFSA